MDSRDYLQLESDYILKLTNVVLVSSMRRNVISLPRLEQLGFSFNVVMVMVSWLYVINQKQWVQVLLMVCAECFRECEWCMSSVCRDCILEGTLCRFFLFVNLYGHIYQWLLKFIRSFNAIKFCLFPLYFSELQGWCIRLGL